MTLVEEKLKITFVSIENTIYDPLTNKLMDSLIINASDFEVVAIGVNRKEQKGVSQSKNDSLHQIINLRSINFSKRLNFARLPILYLEYCYKLLNLLFRVKPNVIYNFNFSTLIPTVIYKYLRKNTTIFYHAREFESHQFNSFFLRKLVIFIESISFPFLNQIFTPSEYITNWYKSKFKTERVSTIYNCPVINELFSVEADYFSSKFSFDVKEKVFIHSGSITFGRNIDLMVSVFSENNVGQLVFIGPITTSQFSYIAEKKIPNVHYHDTVEYNLLVKYLSCADVGLSLGDSSTLSYQLSMGNKFFEYISAKIPIIFTDQGEQVELNKKYHFGTCIKGTYDDLLNAIRIFNSQNQKFYVEDPIELTWNYQRENFLNFFRELEEDNF
jgi:hypothetical protein